MSEANTVAAKLRKTNIPSDGWLRLLANAMEDDVAGNAPLMITGYMVQQVRGIAEELRLTHERLDQVLDAAIDIAMEDKSYE